MAILHTSDIFTPAKLPTVTDVDRTSVSRELSTWVRRGGYFVSLLGNTKLGKTTLVKGFLASQPEGSWTTYIPGQRLGEGSADLWTKLAKDLGIPTSRDTGMANSDKATWKFMARLRVGFAGNSVTGGADAGGEHQTTNSSGEKFDIDPETAVTEALQLLKSAGRTVVIAIDDFHFVQSADARREIVIALRTLTDMGCSVILSTVNSAESDPAFSNTNTGGRRKIVRVPRWDRDELKEIATKGFTALKLWADPSLISDLAKQSFGSPQIMQQLCLDLCETINGILERDDAEDMIEVLAPDDERAFYQSLTDDEAMSWLQRLSAGPNPRKKRKKKSHPGPPPRDLDGYQLIMQSLHEMDSPDEVAVSDLRAHVGAKLGIAGRELTNLALELKARNLGLLASRDTEEALAALTAAEDVGDDDEEAAEEAAFAELVAKDAIPQPVFEVRGVDAQAAIHVLDPLLSYMIRWHPGVIETSGRN